MNKYPNNVATPVQAIPEQPHANEKAHLHTVQAGVQVPFLQALIYGLLFGIAALVLSWVLEADEPWKWGMVVAVIASAGRFLVGDVRWNLLTKLETLTGIELDGNPGIGIKETVHIDLTRKIGGARQTQFLEIPCSPHQLQALAVGIVNRRLPFSGRVWSGKGKPFSDSEFRELRSYLIKTQLIHQSSDKDGRGGFAFTRDGILLLEGYLPSPADVDAEN